MSDKMFKRANIKVSFQNFLLAVRMRRAYGFVDKYNFGDRQPWFGMLALA